MPFRGVVFDVDPEFRAGQDDPARADPPPAASSIDG
jgi:heat shock protein HspQ